MKNTNKKQVLLEFLLSNRDSPDVCLAFDGIIRKSRRAIEDAFAGCTGVSEFMVVYDAAPSAAFLRKNFMIQRNVEVGHVRMPVSRCRVSVKARTEGFGANGETSSTYTSYSGVKAIPRTHLSRISTTDKAKMYPDELATPPQRYTKALSGSPGVPLFWLETKSMQFWRQLVDDLHVKCVVDLSPGNLGADVHVERDPLFRNVHVASSFDVAYECLGPCMPEVHRRERQLFVPGKLEWAHQGGVLGRALVIGQSR